MGLESLINRNKQKYHLIIWLWGDIFVQKTEMGTIIFNKTFHSTWFFRFYLLFRRNSFMGKRDKYLAYI